jgi:hypothetical protein
MNLSRWIWSNVIQKLSAMSQFYNFLDNENLPSSSPLTQGHYLVTRKNTLDIKVFSYVFLTLKFYLFKRSMHYFLPDFLNIHIKVSISIF